MHDLPNVLECGLYYVVRFTVSHDNGVSSLLSNKPYSQPIQGH